MRNFSQLAFLLILAASTGLARPAEVIDRIVATVNGHVILQSDWDDAVRLEALAEGRALNQITDQDRSRALDRLIDQELVREQGQGAEAPQPPAAELQQRRSEEHTSELQSLTNLVCRLLLEKKKKNI